MKKLFLLLLLIPVIAQAQDWDKIDDSDPEQPAIKQYANKPVKNFRDSVNYQLDYMRYCFDKHNNEYTTGLFLEGIGYSLGAVGFIAIAGSSVDDRLVPIALVASGASVLTGLVGSIMVIHSDKWFKRAAITPTRYGISFEVLF